MNKSGILEMINKEQNRRNCFINITEQDLEKAEKAVKDLQYFGYKEKKAAEIIAERFASRKNWYPADLVRQMEKSTI